MPCSLLRSKPKEMRMLLVILFSLIIGCAAQEQKSCKRIVCVVDNLNVPKDFIENETPKEYCTHIIYDSSALVGNNLTHMFTYELSVRGRRGLYAKLNSFKRGKPSLKTLLRVSVPWYAPKPFATLVASEDSRREFISRAIIYLRKNNFDGLDIHWKYPTKDGVKEEKSNFLKFLEEASNAFQDESKTPGRNRLQLSATVNPVQRHYYDIPKMASYVDFVNVNNFEIRGPWDRYMTHHSTLFGYYGAAITDQDWIYLGMPAEKLNLGISFSGFYAHVDNKTHHSNQMKIVRVARPLYTPHSSGTLPFHEICKLIIDQNNVHRDELQRVPYFFNDGLWVGYDDILSVAEKGLHAMEKGYGVWVDNVQYDDHNGTACDTGKYPLLRSIFSGCHMPSS